MAPRLIRVFELAAVATLAAVSGALAFVGLPLDPPGRSRAPARAVPAPMPEPVPEGVPPHVVTRVIRDIARPPRNVDPFALLLPPPRAWQYHPEADLELAPVVATGGMREIIEESALLDDPDDGRAVDLLFLLGASYHRIADYERAAEYYEAYARHAPSADGAAEALENAILFRRALGQADHALSDAELYERWYGETRVSDAARVSGETGELLRDRGGHVEAVSHYAGQVARYAPHVSDAEALRMRVRLGRAHWDAGEKREAVRIFRRVVSRWRHGLAERIAATPDDGHEESGAEFSRTLSDVAEAAYLLAELRYDAFRALAPPEYAGDRTLPDVEAWTSRELRPWIVRKAHALRDARDAYDRVAALGVTEHQIASRARIGQMFRILLDDLAAVPMPEVIVPGDELTPEVRLTEARWREPALAQLRAPALAAFEQCLRTAVRTRHFGEHSSKCADELTRIDPRAHPADVELRPTRLRTHDAPIDAQPAGGMLPRHDGSDEASGELSLREGSLRGDARSREARHLVQLLDVRAERDAVVLRARASVHADVG